MRNFQTVVHAVLVAPAIVMFFGSFPGTLGSRLQEDQQQQQEQQQLLQENRELNLVNKSRLYNKNSRDWTYSNNYISNDSTNPPTEVVDTVVEAAAAAVETITTTTTVSDVSISDVSIDIEPRSSSGFVRNFLRAGKSNKGAKGSKKKGMLPKSVKGGKFSKKGGDDDDDDDEPSRAPTEAPIQSGPGPSPVPTSRPTTSSPTTKAPTNAPTTTVVLPTVPPTPVPTQAPTTPKLTPIPSPDDTAPPTTFVPTTFLPTAGGTDIVPSTTFVPTTFLPTISDGQAGALSRVEFQALEAVGVVTNENKQQVKQTLRKQEKKAKADKHQTGAAAGKRKDNTRRNRLGLIHRGFGGD